MTRVLIIEDNETVRVGMRATLEGAGFDVLDESDGNRGLAAVDAGGVDVVVTDLKMAPVDGLTVLREVKARRPEIEVMLVTAFGTIETAVEAMKSGAVDFITKPFSPETLEVKVRHIAGLIEERGRRERAEAETAYHREQVERRFRVDEIIGESGAMVQVFKQIQKVAPADAAVLITGESGTGKELVARAIHRNSPREGGAFITVNCGALAEGVLESELFGHEKGAFTGAVKTRRGRFELADGGSIFLDEIGEVPLGTQVKLLRVLQEKTFERVGGRGDDSGRRSRARGHKSEPQRRGGERSFPRGPLLPPPRHTHRAPAASRAAGGHRHLGPVLPRPHVRGARHGSHDPHRRGRGVPRVLSLAGKRAGVGKHHAASTRPVRHERDRARRPAGVHAVGRRQCAVAPQR